MVEHIKYKSKEELIEKSPNPLKNAPTSEGDLELMKEWLDCFIEVLDVNPSVSGLSEAELEKVETRLGAKLPSALRLMYSYVGNDVSLLEPGLKKAMNLKLLPANELQIERNVTVHDAYSGEPLYKTDVLVYCVTLSGKKPEAGVDLGNDWGVSFYKQWYWTKDGRPQHKDLLVLLVCIAISRMDNIFKTKVKGITSFNSDKHAEELFEGYFNRFRSFEHYFHTIFYNTQHKALGWFRAGSSTPDLLVGSNSKAFVDELIEKFDFSKARHERVAGVDVAK